MTSHSRQVVRKRLADDCLLEGELHPSIAERLARIREVASISAANLLSVERDEEGVWLVWEHVPGVTLHEYLSTPRTSVEREQVARDLKRAVGSLHAHGIIHGAIHARNIILDPLGRVRLTHISPLLYFDPADDERAMQQLLGQLVPDKEPLPGANVRIEPGVRHREYAKALLAAAGGIVIFFAILWYIQG
jgi:serine/threonine protein kinase